MFFYSRKSYYRLFNLFILKIYYLIQLKRMHRKTKRTRQIFTLNKTLNSLVSSTSLYLKLSQHTRPRHAINASPMLMASESRRSSESAIRIAGTARNLRCRSLIVILGISETNNLTSWPASSGQSTRPVKPDNQASSSCGSVLYHVFDTKHPFK